MTKEAKPKKSLKTTMPEAWGPREDLKVLDRAVAVLEIAPFDRRRRLVEQLTEEMTRRYTAEAAKSF